jgi:hypothetical protein
MYKRSYVCRICFESGHNQRTCPKLRERAANNPGGHSEYLVKKHEMSGKNRVCSYCQESGHNRATCQKLSNDRVGALLKNQALRKKAFEFFKEHKIGLGTLLQYTNAHDQEVILMIEGIEWDNIIYQNDEPSIQVNVFGERKPFYDLKVNDHFFNLFVRVDGSRLCVLVPASEDNIGVAMPANWMQGLTNIEKAFPAWVK